MHQKYCDRAWLVAATCGLVILVGCQRASKPSGPMVDGKTLQEWADAATAPLEPDHFVDVHHRDRRAREKRAQALKNIEKFDAAAIPVLLKLRRTGDLDLQSDAGRILSQIGSRISPEATLVIPLLASLEEQPVDAKSKQWAETSLLDIGSGTPAVDAMMKPLSEHRLRSVVVVDLAKADWWINEMSFSKKPIDALRDIANPSAARTSSDAAYADAAKLYEQVTQTKMQVIENSEIGRLPPIAELIQSANQPRSMLYSLQGLERHAKSQAAIPGIDLGSLAPELNAAVPVLIENVQAGHGRFAPQSMRILGLIGPEASEAVPLAIEMLESDSYDARAEAAAALGGFGVGSREVVQALVASVDREKSIQQGAVQRHRPGSRQGRGHRSQLPRGTLRANVAVSLGRLAAHPDLSIPALEKMLDLNYMGSSERCDLAAKALEEFGH